ncbi:hypothetical protein D3C71_1816300 [compost metagenome]
MKQFDEEGSSEPHNDKPDKAAGKNNKEHTAVQTADLRKTAGRKRHGQCDCGQDRIDGKRDIRDFDFKHGQPEAGLLSAGFLAVFCGCFFRD